MQCLFNFVNAGSGGFLVTHRALRGRRALRCRYGLFDLGMTTRASSVKSLLIVERDHRRASLVLDLGNSIEQFRLFARSGVTVAACVSTGSGRILRK